MPDKGLLALAPSPQQQMGSASSKNSNKSGFNFRRAFAGRRKHSDDIHSPPQLATSASYPLTTISTSQNNVLPPLPPPKSSQSTLPPAPSENTQNLLRTHVHPPPLNAAHSAQPLLQSAPAAAVNRSSIIPLSPGIESAVNYMAMSDQMELTSSSSPSLSTTHVKRRITQQISDSDASRQRLLQDTEDNASKRKSDSTISQCTIRPVTGSKSRPVSVADSFQSSYTIVPGNPSVTVVVNKRFSTVGVLEEDDDTDALSFKSMDDPVQEKEKEPTQLLQPNSQLQPLSSSSSARSTSPMPSLAKQKRRSMSLNIGPTTSKVHHHPLVPNPPPSASAADLKHPSYSISEGLYTAHGSSSNLLAVSNSSSSTSGSHGWPVSGLHPNRNQTLPLPPVPFISSSPNNNHLSPAQVPSSARQHPHQQFTYPTPRPLPPHPAPPPSFRQTAVSFTSSLAPAAGLARKAVEKMKGALGHMGSGPAIGSASSASISSHSSSMSATSVSTGPSSYQGIGVGLVRTPSNQSSAAQSSNSHLQMHSVNIKEMKEREKEEKKREKRNKRQRRTPNASSGGTYSIASISTNGSDSDGLMMSPEPHLGIVLRGSMLNRHGGVVIGGVVFGRELKECVRETAVKVSCSQNQIPNNRHIQQRTEEEMMGRPELKVYEKRMLPALVARCAQHLLIWGIQEEGLFRVPGRAAHIAKLRSEFDTGMDYDMSGSSPGDLDPHAVASTFKAYLRELPEHILTNKLAPYFDAAIGQESTVAATDQNFISNMMSGNGTKLGIGLPASQKPLPNINLPNSSPFPSSSSSQSQSQSQPQPQLRKPPSLSTLAMPSFASARPASKHLLSALRTLISKLPKENQDLLRTVVELIRATAKESKLTKMPLNNLLMVFLPSLNIGVGLLKLFCEEEEGVWSGYLNDEREREGELEREQQAQKRIKEDKVVDIKRVVGVLDIKRHDGDVSRESEDEDEVEDEVEDDVDDDEQRRWTIVDRYGHGRQDFMEGEVVDRNERVQTIYLDSRSQASSVSVATSSHESTSASASVSMSSSSVSANSNLTRETSSSAEESNLSSSLLLRDDSTSFSLSSNDGNSHYLPSSEEYGYEKDQDDGVLSSEVESVLTPTTSSQASLPNIPVSMDTAKDLNEDDRAYLGFIRPVTPSRLPADVQFPTVRLTSPLQPQPQQSQTRSESLHAYTQQQQSPPTQHSTSVRPKRKSIPSLTFAALGGNNNNKEKENWEESSLPHEVNSWSSATGPSSPGGPRLRKKRPSLRLLFSQSKISTGSLNGTGSNGYSVPGTPGTPGSGTSLINPYSPYTGMGRSDSSSVSTPLSAVTAHSLSFSLSGSGSGDGSSTAEMPPVIDTPIEEGKSFRSELGLDESPPGTSATDEYQVKLKEEEEKERKKREKRERIKTLVGQTPIADWYLTASAASSVADLSVPPVPTITMHQVEQAVQEGGGAVRRPVLGRGATRKGRVTSTLSMNHLGLNDEQLLSLDGEDWTRTVLLAADLEPGAKTGNGGSRNRSGRKVLVFFLFLLLDSAFFFFRSSAFPTFLSLSLQVYPVYPSSEYTPSHTRTYIHATQHTYGRKHTNAMVFRFPSYFASLPHLLILFVLRRISLFLLLPLSNLPLPSHFSSCPMSFITYFIQSFDLSEVTLLFFLVLSNRDVFSFLSFIRT